MMVINVTLSTVLTNINYDQIKLNSYFIRNRVFLRSLSYYDESFTKKYSEIH